MNIRDREGLWKVNKHVQKVFIQREKFFRAQTNTFKTSVWIANLLLLKWFKTCTSFHASKQSTFVWKQVCFNVLVCSYCLLEYVRSRLPETFVKNIQ